MPPKKEEKPDYSLEIGFIVLMAFFLWYIWSAIINAGVVNNLWQNLTDFFASYIWPTLSILLIILAVALFFGIFHAHRGLRELGKRQKKIYHPGPEDLTKAEEGTTNEHWGSIQKHMSSSSQNDWRQAIIEADVMLDELLRSKGYHGESVGEMLKAVDKSDFLTLEAAWEAHKVRNEIAHGGLGFQINEREAKRVIALYESVFREFRVI